MRVRERKITSSQLTMRMENSENFISVVLEISSRSKKKCRAIVSCAFDRLTQCKTELVSIVSLSHSLRKKNLPNFFPYLITSLHTANKGEKGSVIWTEGKLRCGQKREKVFIVTARENTKTQAPCRLHHVSYKQSISIHQMWPVSIFSGARYWWRVQGEFANTTVLTIDSFLQRAE